MDLSSKQGRREQGRRIQSAVERAGLSIEELAGRIGCSRALIYQYLSGSTLAQPDRLQQIGAECGVPLTYFYSDAISDSDSAATIAVAETGKPPATDTTPAPETADVAARLAQSVRTLTELADAQESPPDFRSLAGTCEQLYFLAVQLGDRTAQAKTQYRLGNACLRTANYSRAAEALRLAIQLAHEVGLSSVEADARQSLGNVLVSTGNLTEAREQFAAIAAGEQLAGRWKGTLSLGSVHTMHGEYREAMERFDEAANILEEAEASGAYSAKEAAIGLLYVNGNRTNVYLNGGDFQGARPLIEKCLDIAETYGIVDEHLEARFDLAWCDFHTGRWAAAYRGLTSMLQLARFVGDQGKETMARAWLAMLTSAFGDFEGAISQGKDALSMALSRGDRRGELYSQLALADAYTGQTRRESEARYHANQALAVALSLRSERAEAECRLRLARISLKPGDQQELVESASRALTLSRKLGARHLECLALCWLARANEGSLELATQALSIAEMIGLTEGKWRSLATVGQMSEDVPHLNAAVELLKGLRDQLIEAGAPDTLLENEDCLKVYEDLVKTLYSRGNRDEAAEVIEAAGWPPLEMRFDHASS